MKHVTQLTIVVVGVGLFHAAAAAQNVCCELDLSDADALLGSSAQEGEGFGTSIALHGSTLIVGGPSRDIGLEDNVGRALVFVDDEDDGWTQVQEMLEPVSDRDENDNFGSSVAFDLDSNLAVIGAPGDAASKGTAYIFERDSGVWGGLPLEEISTGSAGDEFGFSVAISGDTIVVGAPGVDTGNGAIHVFVPHATTPDVWSSIRR